MKFCIKSKNYIRLLLLSAKLFDFEIQKCGGKVLCLQLMLALFSHVRCHLLSLAFTQTAAPDSASSATVIQLRLPNRCAATSESAAK